MIMRTYIIDGSQFASSNELHTYFAKIFNFPAHCGKNFNAMWDCINESLGDWGKEVVEIRWINMFQSRANNTSEDVDVAVEILNDISKIPGYKVSFE
ncbi:MAG: hypothetical protein EOP04_06910, partial [Proteobacteria bacterium]